MPIELLHRFTGKVAGLFFAIVLCAMGFSGRCADIMVNQAQTFQTIEGWGNGSGNLGGQFDNVYRLLGPAIADPVNYQMLDYLADDLGLTGTRVWEIGERTDGTGTDVNGDCDVIDWDKFQPGPYADVDGRYLGYFRDRVIAGGAQPNFYSSPIYAFWATGGKPWVLNHPGERAQQIWANALYWRDHYGLNMNYAVIANEPGFGGSTYSTDIVADDLKALGPRLAAHGLATKIQFPEAVDPEKSWTMISAVQNDADVWPYVGRLSYHRYGTDDPYRSYIRDFGLAKGIRTAQTETGGANIGNMYADMIQGGVSYWEVSFSSSNTLVPNAGQTTYTQSAFYYPIRQVTHYVRPGAVRIGTTSSDQAVSALAFVKNNLVTTVVLNTSGAAQTINISGLPAGTYGLSRSFINSTNPFQEFGLQTVGTNGTIALPNVPFMAVITLYPYAGPNHPPTISTWTANPGRVTPPASTATLSVIASDPERDPLTYAWSVAGQPAGVSAVIANPTSANTAVNGLTVEGLYTFTINVRDGINTSTKQLYLVVGPNMPPVFGVSGFRFGSPYVYAMDWPGETPLHTNIVLPTPTVTLSANISDLENDTLTGQWNLVNQPAGANVTLSNQIYIYLSFRAAVNGMTVPGDYVFQLDAHDPTHTVSLQVSCTVHPANTAPAINTITATPANPTVTGGVTQLSANTSDPENDLLRHWWVVKTAPAGAKPTFDHQGLANTVVRNLTVAGNYTFTLRCFDDIHMTTRDFTFTVNPPPPVPQPDLLLKTSTETEYLGNGIINLDAEQTKAQTIEATASAIFHLKVQNAGYVDDDIVVTGPADSGGWTSQYFDALVGGNDITTQVHAGWHTGTLGINIAKDFCLELTPDATVHGGTVKDVRITAASAADASKTDAVIAETSVRTLTGVTLSASPASPRVINTPITLTAIPAGGNNVQYQFRVGYSQNGAWSWSTLRSYNTTPTCTWRPTVARTYMLQVWARETGNTALYQVAGTLGYTMTPPLSAVRLTATPPSPLLINTPITLTTYRTGGASVEYQFRLGYKENDTWSWSILRPYSTTATCAWRPTVAHNYTVQVWAREIGYLGAYQAITSISVFIADPLSAVSLTTLPASPQRTGTPIVLYATPTGGAKVQYQFRIGYVENNVWHWSLLRMYGLSPTRTWTPTVARRYTLMVWAREYGSTAPYQFTAMLGYTVNP